jgi:hypothetical protein
MNPHSSANAAKIKSVLYSGKKLRRDCVPYPIPLPNNPPEPTAIVGDMVTVKRYERKNGVTILYPESKNPKYKPIVLREDFKIAGKVLCVIPNPHAELTEVVYE